LSCAERVYEIGRTLHRDDLANRPDHLGKIGRCVTRACADIEHFASSSNAGSFPAIQNDRLPGAMLHPETFELGFMCAEDVIAFR
jgi:hypothetical protein